MPEPSQDLDLLSQRLDVLVRLAVLRDELHGDDLAGVLSSRLVHLAEGTLADELDDVVVVLDALRGAAGAVALGPVARGHGRRHGVRDVYVLTTTVNTGLLLGPMRATRPDRQRGAGSRARYRPRGGYRARAAGRRAARRSPRSSRALRLPRAPRSARSFQTTLNQPDQSALRSRGENHQRLQFGSTNRQNRPQLWFQHRRTRAALSAPLRVDVAVMAAARGTPGASLVTLVTASLQRRAAGRRPRRGRAGRGGAGEGRYLYLGKIRLGANERGGDDAVAGGARARARRPRGVRVILRARIRGDAGRGSRARRRAARARGEGGRAPPPAPAPVVHSYFATFLGATTDPGDALEMLRDAPACLRRNRLVEMKKAAKAEATRKRLHSLLEAGERLDAATFPGLASAFFPTHAADDSASSDDADERRRELRRLFPGGALYVDERPRTYPMSTDDDNLAPSLSAAAVVPNPPDERRRPAKRMGTKPTPWPVSHRAAASPGDVDSRVRQKTNDASRSIGIEAPRATQRERNRRRRSIPSSSRRADVASADPALSRGRDTGDSHRARGTRAVRTRLRPELVRATRRVHHQAKVHQRDGPHEKGLVRVHGGGAFASQ